MLRPYQLDAVARVRDAYRRDRRVLLVAPTGSGKTVMGADMVRAAVARGRRVLWVAHRAELLGQAHARLTREGLDACVLAPWATYREGAPVLVASVQTLLARDMRPPADLVVLDEAHHYVAREWATVAQSYASAWVLGLTATPVRSDGIGLGDLFGVLVQAAPYSQLVQEGHLVGAEVWAPSSRLRGELAADPIALWSEHAREAARTVVYGAHVAHAVELRDRWRAAGVPAEHIDGETPADERRSHLAALASGAVRVVTNVHVLTEGWDCPALDCVVLARGFASVGSYLQACGRALRPSPGKSRGIVLDLAGAAHEHGLPDADREWYLEDGGEPAARAPSVHQCPHCGACWAPATRICPRCGAEQDLPESPAERAERLERFRERATGETRMRSLARWQALAEERGYSRGWVAHRYRAVYGEWPR